MAKVLFFFGNSGAEDSAPNTTNIVCSALKSTFTAVRPSPKSFQEEGAKTLPVSGSHSSGTFPAVLKITSPLKASSN